MSKTARNILAQRLRALHVPGRPLLLSNVHDAFTAQLVASEPSCKAIATASWSIAATQGVDDNDMTLAQNLAGIRNVAKGLSNAGKRDSIPLSADLQDGYGDPAETTRKAIELGVVGCNLEDTDNTVSPPTLRSLEDAVARIKTVLAAAEAEGVPDFAVNARTDVFGYDKGIAEVLERGKAFLEAGATSVFVWGVGKKVISVEEVKEMSEAFGGKLAVQARDLSVAEQRDAGVCRISVGPMYFRAAMETFKEKAVTHLEA